MDIQQRINVLFDGIILPKAELHKQIKSECETSKLPLRYLVEISDFIVRQYSREQNMKYTEHLVAAQKAAYYLQDLFIREHFNKGRDLSQAMTAAQFLILCYYYCPSLLRNEDILNLLEAYTKAKG